MVTIRKGRDVLTLVNVFSVRPQTTFDPILCEVSESVSRDE